MERFPNEIWLKIVQHLNAYDVMQFCTAFPQYNYFLRDKDIVKSFDLGGKYELYEMNLVKEISNNVEYRFIKALNINKLYWIPVNDIRSIIKLLPQLEEVRALDTQLGVREKDVKVYSKLRKLAISVEFNQFVCSKEDYCNNMYMLRSFCIKILSSSNNYRELPLTLFEALIGLEELWIYHADDRGYPIKYDYIIYNLKFLKKLVIKTKISVPFLEYKPFGLAKVFEIRRFQSIVMYYVKCPIDQIVPVREVSIFEPLETPLEEAWQFFQKLSCEMPADSDSAEKIYQKRSLKNIEFKELNFYHNRCFCYKLFINASITILKSVNATNLRKLSIKSCLLQANNDSKRQRAEYKDRDYPFKTVVENCKMVTELELMSCMTCNITIMDAYPLIIGFSKLTTLTIEVPSHVDGRFFKDIFSTLKLEFLNVISKGTNERLNLNLYSTLPNATTLKHFRFQNVHIHIDRFFSSLNQMKECRLQRLVFICSYASAFQDGPNLKHLRGFLERNPQLLFLFISISDSSHYHIKEIKDLIMPFAKSNPAKIFVANRDPTIRYYGNFPIPDTHKEFIYYETHVGTIRFEEF